MKNLALYIFSLTAFLTYSQGNIIPNADFENYSQCPNDDDQLSFVYPWYSTNGNTSDYFNSCAVWGGVGFNPDVPTNTYGYQEAQSGNGYIGLNMVPPIGYFEYATVKMTQPMVAGTEYCVSLWVSLSDESCWSTNMLSTHFTVDTIYTPDNHIDLIPTLTFTEMVDQQQEWVNLQATYVSPYGGERFMTIGIFDDDYIQTLQFCSEPYGVNGSYFFIDNITVEELTEESVCSESDNFDGEITNVITANGDGVNDVWSISTLDEHEVVILNRWGNVVYENKGTVSTWTAADVVDGVYFYRIKYKEHDKQGFITVIK